MRILVVGGGGREHALVWKLAQFHKTIYCAPGNTGISQVAECVDIQATDITGLAEFAARERIDLTVVGPEVPLVAGIAEEFRKRGLVLFGPTASAARLEGDKSFAKSLMQEHGIPTARFEVFSEYELAKEYLGGHELPVVLKTSGLAAGKGVVICHEPEQAGKTLREMMVEGRFGEAGRTVVVEEFLTGEEVSIIGLCDGTRVVMTVPSQDHKRLQDGDRGPNTGGMGAYAPAPAATAAVGRAVEEKVFKPLLAGLKSAGIDYRGVIYAGIMLTDKGPSVLEFNCRFGDPETQAVLPLLDNDLGELLLACAQGDLTGKRAVWKEQSAMCVVAASGGYPGQYRKGIPISGDLTARDDVIVFHAGTRREEDRVVTNGGRVLGVTGIGSDLHQARDRTYGALAGIDFDGMFFRRDIGRRGLERLSG